MKVDDFTNTVLAITENMFSNTALIWFTEMTAIQSKDNNVFQS